MSKIRVLIVDDSGLVQEVLSAILRSEKGVEVIGCAGNGKEALEMILNLKPDLVTTDISMPVMDGLEMISRVMAKCPLPILVISDIKDSKVAFYALSQGALEVIGKSEIQPEKATEFLRKIRILSKVKVIRHINSSKDKGAFEIADEKRTTTLCKKVVAIASSTGGPKGLSIILPAFPANFPSPIVIAQHIEKSFVPSLVDWLDSVTPLTVKIGQRGEKIIPGTVYVSPSDNSMVISKTGEIVLSEDPQGQIYHPSCNKLLASVASAYGRKSVGVILTGMGNDGVEGLKAIKDKHGTTIAQDQASCVVFGMPQEAIVAKCVDTILPLRNIGARILEIAG